jgi:hypothetical protein
MTTEQFVYWLQGFMEICNPETLDENQTQIIKDHLKLVFDKQTPERTITVPGMTTTPCITTPLAPMPTIPYPKWQEPHKVPPYDITCDTATGKKSDKSGGKKSDKSGPTVFC